MKPDLVAHRGYALRYPENTLAAFQAAITAGARFVECDVQLSAARSFPLPHYLPSAAPLAGGYLMHWSARATRSRGSSSGRSLSCTLCVGNALIHSAVGSSATTTARRRHFAGDDRVTRRTDV